jgi:uncharacterized membrane protein YqjE
MDEAESKSGGVLASVRRIFDSVLALLHSRLELAVIELQEEKNRLLGLLLRVAGVVVLGMLTLVTATATVVVIFWDQSPVLTLGLVTAVYALATGAVWWGLRRRLQTGPPPFADTLAEFKKDRAGLEGKK